MKTVEMLQIFSALLGAFSSIVLGMEQKLVKRLKKENAINPETAVELSDLHLLSRWRLSRLRNAGAVQAVGSDRYYFRPSSYKSLRKKRLKIVLPLIALVSLVVFALYLASD